MERITWTPDSEAEPDFETLRQKAIDFLFTYEHEDHFIDKGGVGKVYTLMNGFCIKILDERHTSPNREIFDLGNHPVLEATLQSKMSHTPYPGKTRAPLLYSVVSSDIEGERNAIIMEQLPATNLQHILNNPELLPESFDLDNFFADLEEYIEHMHEVEGIAHNDLYARNIMVDLETGEPRVIDFGRSVDLTQVEESSERQKLVNEDWKNLEDTFEKLSKLIMF